MAVSYSSITLPGLLYPQYRPPPLLPKPGKDNVRLQKLLKKSAKKKAAPQITHVPAPFRLCLSPVNEASPDLEHSDHSTPPRTPETPYYYGGTQPQPPRFTVRPLYQHVPSPYPQRAGFARFSPQPAPAPAPAFPQHVTPLSSHVQQSYVIPSFQGSARSATPAPEVTKPAFKVTIVAPAPAPPPKSPHPRSFMASGSETFLQPLTVLVPIGKPKSPRPTFIATDTSRSPKPMFEVPQIRIYTANTSYYEPSRTPPVYDMTGLASIGSALPRSKTPTSEERRATTPTPEVKIVIATSEVKRSVTPTGQTPSSTTDLPTLEVKQGTTPAPEANRAVTATTDNKTALTVTSEVKRSITPTLEVKQGTTTTPEANRAATATSENKRALTVISEVKRSLTPTYDYGRAKTPIGRPKTPSYGTRAATPAFEISRPNPLLFAVPTASTPVSTHAQSVKSTESQITKTTLNSTITVNGDIHLDIAPDIPSAVASTQGSVSKPEIAQQQAQVTDFTKAKTPPLPAAYQRPKTPTNLAPTPAVVVPAPKPAMAVPTGYQRPKTPTNATPAPAIAVPTPYQRPKTPTNTTPAPAMVVPSAYQRPKTPTNATPANAMAVPTAYQRPKTPTNATPAPAMVVPTGYQRPKTPTKATPAPAFQTPTAFQRPRTPNYGASHYGPGPLPADFPRPKTPTSAAVKSTYRGLTPAEYVAFGGIQSFTPAFGISRAKTPTQEVDETEKEISAVPEKSTEQSPVKTHSLVEVSRIEEIAVDDTPGVVPTIVVSQASVVPKVAEAVTSHVAKTPEKLTVEIPDVKPPEKERTPTPTQQDPKPKLTTPEENQPVPSPASTSDVKVPLMTKSKPLIKEVALIADSVAKTGTQTSASEQKESVKPKFVTSVKAEDSKPITPALPTEGSTPAKALVKSTVNKDKVKDEKDAPDSAAVPATAKKEGDGAPLAAEPLLKALLKPKGAKSKLSGWSRLKKHMVVEQEEPQFPEAEPSKEPTGQDQSTGQKDEQKPSEKSADGNETASRVSTPSSDSTKAPQMWDAVLFGMFSSKEKIMHQIELSKREQDKKEEKEEKEEKPAEKKGEAKDTEIPTFAHRLPVLLFSPRFDAKRLREAASRPLTKISTVFEMGLIGRKNKEEEPKDFNRTARGFTAS